MTDMKELQEELNILKIEINKIKMIIKDADEKLVLLTNKKNEVEIKINEINSIQNNDMTQKKDAYDPNSGISYRTWYRIKERERLGEEAFKKKQADEKQKVRTGSIIRRKLLTEEEKREKMAC